MAHTAQILLLSFEPPRPQRLAGLAATLARSGARATLLTMRVPHGAAIPSRLDLHALVPAAEAHGPAFRRSSAGLKGPERLHYYLAHDPWVREQLADGPVLMGLDPVGRAVAAWVRDEHRRLVVATNREELLAALESRRRSRMAGALARSLRGARWRARTGDDDLGGVALEHLRHGRTTRAERVVLDAVAREDDSESLADLVGDYTNAALARGVVPALLLDTVRAELAAGDERLARGDFEAAATWFGEAMRVAFHRAAHLDGLCSPLAEDPASYGSLFRDSRVMSRLSASRGREMLSAARGQHARPAEAPRRVLITTWGNANFLGKIRQHLEMRDDTEARFLDAQELGGFRPYVGDATKFAEQILTGRTELRDVVEAHFREHLDWADTVLIDWCTMLPALLTLIDPADTRIVVRLHSVEAFTHWPQLVDFSRVDDLVFVSDHLRDLTVASVPALSAPDAPRLHVLPLAMELEKFALPKLSVREPDARAEDPRFTLGLIGWSAVAKDPGWALAVIEELRRHDGRYRLVLYGDQFNDKASAAAQHYGRDLWPRLAELERTGAVERRGRTDDIPHALRKIGVILSSSVREGCHTAVMEGAASGAVPVVRDWPFFAGQPNGASTLFPSQWVVGTPQHAVQRILECTTTEATWRGVGKDAAAVAFERWGWEQVRPGYEQILLG